MRPAGKLIFLFLGIVSSLGCHSGPSGGPAGTSASAGSEIPPFRKVVKRQPVASYREKTDNPLNDWYFSVNLYETPKTFQYLIKMQFEEVRGEDTLELPDLGIYPHPVLQKGKDRYSCVIGFLDQDSKFKEYKLVFVKDGRQLKLVPLRHYAMVPSADK